MSTDLKINIWTKLSIILSVLGLFAWLPNFIFQYGYSYWLLTFILNPIGIALGIIGKSKLGIILNIIMTFSFFILMFIGYFLVATFGGKP